jgi:hypothetical protein
VLPFPALDKLPVPRWLDLPPVMLVVLQAICIALLVFAGVRALRVKPALWSAIPFVALALAGGALQLGDAWWEYSVTALILLTLACAAAAAEVAGRRLTRQHAQTATAFAAVNLGSYLYLAAVLRAHS